MQLSGTEPLNDAHRPDTFDCGKPALNAWLHSFARNNQALDFTRVMVVHNAGNVIGYYGVAPSVIQPNSAPRTIRTGPPPDPIPCLLIDQLAVGLNYTSQDIGGALVKDALQRCVRGADTIGGRAIIVPPVDADAERYWKSWGFVASRDNPSILMRSM